MTGATGVRTGPSRRVVGLVGFIVVLLAAVVAISALRSDDPTGDPGQLSETARELPAGVPLPELSVVTEAWGLGDFGMDAADDRMAGGIAVADLDGDRAKDIVVANGDVVVLLSTLPDSEEVDGSAYEAPISLGVDEAIGVTTSDIDRDGHVDVLVATAGDVDIVFWGGTWSAANGEAPERTELRATGQSSNLLAGELSGDDRIDIVRLGRGGPDTGPQPDILWVADIENPRQFSSQELPVPDRFTLAGELVDVDGDGLLDIWLTRDVGWARGGDSVLSRQGDPFGPWVDVAASLGLALEIDGMGITVADLNGDGDLDAYVSDLGDNEVMLGSGTGFAPALDTGAAHIRPAGAADDRISSTWGTGAIDINLDGVLDLVAASGGFPVGSVSNKIDGTEVVEAEPPAVLLGLGDGTFVDVWPQLDIELDVVARGMAIADLDNDADDDVVIVDRRGGIQILRNDATGPTVVLFLGPESGCSHPVGAVVTVTVAGRTYQRLLQPHGYASAHSREIIVGNPTTGDARVEVFGPGWEVSPLNVRIDGADRLGTSFACSP